jgi:hypothetical protein
MERVTFIVPWAKSTSPHFRANGSPCRKPVVTARRTRVFSRSAKASTNIVISAGVSTFGVIRRFYALANQPDGVQIKQLVPHRMVEEYRHHISDLGAGASLARQTTKPGFHFDRPHYTEIIMSPACHAGRLLFFGPLSLFRLFGESSIRSVLLWR